MKAAVRIPNENLKKLIEASAIRKPAETQMYRLPCPVCVGGYVFVGAEVRQVGPRPSDKEVHIPDIKEPRKCEVCDAILRIKTKFQIVMEQIKEE